MQGQLSTTIKGKLQTFNFQIPLYILPNDYNPIFAALELAGSPSAIRAAWAHLVKHREDDKARTDVKINILGDWDAVYVMPKKKIICISMENNLLLLAPEFMAKSRQYFFGGTEDEPSPYFMDAFRINVPNVPVLPEWKQQLWTKGLENRLIQPMIIHGCAMTAWNIMIKGWESIVKEMVVAWHN
jgi:hypothetical protein